MADYTVKGTLYEVTCRMGGVQGRSPAKKILAFNPPYTKSTLCTEAWNVVSSHVSTLKSQTR